MSSGPCTWIQTSLLMPLRESRLKAPWPFFHTTFPVSHLRKGDHVFTQTVVEKQKGTNIGNLSIGMGSYNYDAHNAQR